MGPDFVSAKDLSPDEFFLWEERTAIMHYYDRKPWPEAERLALADILSQLALWRLPRPLDDMSAV